MTPEARAAMEARLASPSAPIPVISMGGELLGTVPEPDPDVLDPAITPEDARLFLESIRLPSDRALGSFESALTEALWSADRANQDRLAKGFPGLVAALRLYRTIGGPPVRDTLAALRQRAGQT